MNLTSQGYIEHYFASILSAIRELEEMFPSGQATQREFLVRKGRLLKLFHQMGSSAAKVEWYEPVYPRDGNPCGRFSEFAPDRLDSAKFSFGYFQRCMEETVGDDELLKTLSLRAGEEDSKYQKVKDERKRRRDALIMEYSDIRQKCWFWFVVLGTLLLGVSGVLIGLREWLLYVLFIPPMLGAAPLGGVLLLTFERFVTVEEAKTSWDRTRLDVIWSGIRDIDNEIEYLEKNQTKWRRRFAGGKYGIIAGVAISAAALPCLVIAW